MQSSTSSKLLKTLRSPFDALTFDGLRVSGAWLEIIDVFPFMLSPELAEGSKHEHVFFSNLLAVPDRRCEHRGMIMAPESTGLTLGKYAPLHQGHQLVIETALAEMPSVIALIYDAPEVTACPLGVRARWLRELYPRIEVLEAWDGPTLVSDAPAIQKMHEEYILQRLAGRRITHFYSSEFYGEHVSRALGAVNRLVDPDRTRVPVSGTEIRQEPYRWRRWVHPRVYRDLIANVAFLGAPCTGKTTLAQRMAEEFGTVWMPEYGREYWDRYQVNRRLTRRQLVDIAEGHLEREEDLLYQADRYFFTDTTALTTYVFSLYYHGQADARLAELARAAACRYDLVFLCDIDIPYDATWDRSGDANRRLFQKQVVADLQERKIPYFTVRGSVEQRVAAVKSVLACFQKYGNLVEVAAAWQGRARGDTTR